jgi:hypothetical protein
MLTKQEKVFWNDTCDKGLLPRIYKQFSPLNDKKRAQIKMGKSFEQIFYQNRYKDGISAHERYLTSVVTKEMQFKSIIKCCSTLLKWLKLKVFPLANITLDAEELKLSCTAAGKINGTNTLKNSLALPYNYKCTPDIHNSSPRYLLKRTG